MQIVVGNLSGFLTGEWKLAGASAVRLMLAGVAVLAVASTVMAMAITYRRTDQKNPE